MTEEVKLKLKKRRHSIYETEFGDVYIDFYKLPSDGLWRTNYFGENRTFSSMKIAKMVVEKELKEKVKWLKVEGYA
jgi:hypothetical protein